MTGCVAACGLVSAEIIESQKIGTVTSRIDDQTWVLLDLDNTVFEAEQALGHVNWLQGEIQKRMSEGSSKEDAVHSMYPLWKKTQMLSKVRVVEEEFVESIQKLQERNVVVIGVTHRQPFLVKETLRQLGSLGVYLLKTAPSQEDIEIKAQYYPALYTQGVLFVDDFNSKGEIFFSFLGHLEHKPRKIFFVDDKRKNVEDLALAAQRGGVEFTGVHYTAVDAAPPIYRPELAAIQLRFLNERLMSNEEAQQLIEQPIDEVSMNSASDCPKYLYKIVSMEKWKESLHCGHFVPSEMDREFVHFSMEDQLARVADKFWKGQDYVVLTIESQQLVGNLVYESNPGGENKYWHLYEGEIPLESIVDVRVIHGKN